MAEWLARGLLRQGSAILREVSPDSVDRWTLYAEDGVYLPTLRWELPGPEIVEALCRYFPTQINLDTEDHPALTELRVDSTVNEDDSLSVSLSVPYNSFENCSEEESDQRFKSFIRVCSRFFSPTFFLAGTVDEEGQLHSVEALGENLNQWTRCAFYGGSLADELVALRSRLNLRPAVWQPLEQGGLFVSWGEWSGWLPAPPEWRKLISNFMASVK